ncbi:MAG: hypothetical protein EA381_00650 [Planctomycetaceae bacterium]|nr:MAG: hypothetical protein EA381_00650 [Planctomycetaceae bacterium]
MSLYLFLLVVCSLACGLIPLDRPPTPVGGGAWIALVAVFGTIVHFVANRASGVAQTKFSSQSFADRLELWRWVGLGLALAGLIGFRFAAAIRFSPLLVESIFLQAIFLLSPAMSLLAITLAAEHFASQCQRHERGRFRSAIPRIAVALFRMVGWLTIPILTLLLIADISRWVWPVAAISAGIPSGLVTLVLAALAIPFLVPWLANRIWQTRPLDDAHFGWLVELSERVVGPGLDVRRWDTGMEFSNAAVVGFFPRARSLLLSDRLLRDASAEQLGLLTLHELAHLRRGHLWMRALAVTPGWLLAVAWVRWVDAGPLSLVLANVAAIWVTLGLLRIVAHTTEYDADRVACQLAIRFGPLSLAPLTPCTTGGQPIAMNPIETDLREQAERYCAALRSVGKLGEGTDTAAAQRTSWMHPSIDARCRSLRDWADKAAGTPHPQADRPIGVATASENL